jgi:peptide/nickel transport system substrate-binding protein
MSHRRTKHLRVFILPLFVLALVFAVACGSSAPAEPVVVEKEVIKEVIREVQKDIIVFATPAPVAMASVRPEWVDIGEGHHYSGDFPFIATRNPGFWDVHYGGSLNTVLIPSSPRFNGLVEYDPVAPTEIIGDLAKGWDLEDGGQTYIFHLNDANFSDGTPVTAEDIVYSFDRITLPGALRARTGFLKLFYEHKTATVIDEKTVRIPLKFPAGAFLPNLASDYMKMYPKALENLSQDDFNCCPEKSFGSGPWVFRNWKKDASFAFDKNEDYFKTGRPFFDGLQVFIISDNSRVISALTAGQAFATYQPISGGNRPTNMAKIEEDTNGRVRALELHGASLQSIWMNTSKPPFDDERVRQAMYLAVDRQAGVDRAAEGFGLPGTYFAPGVVEDLAELAKVDAAYKPDRTEALEKARALMAEAGYPDGIDITFNAVNTPPSLPAAEVFSAQMKKDLNWNVTIEPADLATMYVHMRDGDANLDTVGTGLILRDPGDVLNQWYDTDVLRNSNNWTHPRITELFQLQAKTPDPKERLAQIKEISDILHTGVGHNLPYFWYVSGGAMDYRIRNYHIPPTIQLVHKWDHIWFDPDRKQPKEPGYHP